MFKMCARNHYHFLNIFLRKKEYFENIKRFLLFLFEFIKSYILFNGNSRIVQTKISSYVVGNYYYIKNCTIHTIVWKVTLKSELFRKWLNLSLDTFRPVIKRSFQIFYVINLTPRGAHHFSSYMTFHTICWSCYC